MKLVNETSATSFCRRQTDPLTSSNPKALITDTNCCSFLLSSSAVPFSEINSPHLSLALLRTEFYALLMVQKLLQQVSRVIFLSLNENVHLKRSTYNAQKATIKYRLLGTLPHTLRDCTFSISLYLNFQILQTRGFCTHMY